MPKLLVLVPARGIELAPLADAVLEGARSVRFAEVDVRTLDDAADATSNRKPLAAIDDLASYDGIVVGVPAGDVDGTAVRETFAHFGGSLANKVGSAFTTGSGAGRTAVLWSALSPMADRGMILVPLPFSDDGAASTDACRQMGKRVADVVGWVTHARSHHHHDHH
jgi:multimeric flavodoxin WrbA